MPPSSVGPEALRPLGAALGLLRDGARSGADEVLDHLPEIGDRELQAALDDYLEQVADLLREVDASAADVTGRLRVAAPRWPGDDLPSHGSCSPQLHPPDATAPAEGRP
ncbi:MAG: hypothetical protein WB473_04680 [Pedococcus sp.]